MNLSDLLLLSDVDGTLADTPAPIPERNKKAIRRFTDAGGHFALATGRAPSSTAPFVRQLPVNAPCILYNGCGIYDFTQQKMLHATHLPKTFYAYLEAFHSQFPDAGIAILAESVYASVSGHSYIDRLLRPYEPSGITRLRLEEVTFPCIKAIFLMDEEDFPKISQFIEQQGWNDVSFVRSSPYFYEMLPLNVNKGSCLQTYSNLTGIPLPRIAAIGDYYNDEVMLRSAGISATVEEAPDDIKALCTFVAGSCKNGALADFIEYLEKR